MGLDTTAADAALDTLIAALVSSQAGVKGGTGRYRQCIVGQDWGTWETKKPDPAVVTAWVDEYVAPGGPGYVVCGSIVDKGTTYLRCANAKGAEERRTQGWTALPEDK